MINTIIRSPRLMVLFESALFAGSNFVVTITLARLYSADVFAGYGTSLSLVFAAQTIQRAGLITPVAILENGMFNRRKPIILGCHILLSLVSGLVVLAVLGATAAISDRALWMAALQAAPAIMLLMFGAELERITLIKAGRHAALAGLAATTALLIVVFCLALWWSAAPFVVAMTGLTAIGIFRVLGFAYVAGRADLRGGWRMLKISAARYSGHATAQLFGASTCSHAPVLALAALSTASSAAAYVAMRTLYQPLQVLLRSIDVVDLTRFHQGQANPDASLMKRYGKALLRQGVLSALPCLVLVTAGPSVVHLVYGGRFDGHLAVFALWAVIITLMNLMAVTDRFVIHAAALQRYTLAQFIGGSVVIAACILSVPRGADPAAALSAILGWGIILTGGVWAVWAARPSRAA
jgi:hypothetical protein